MKKNITNPVGAKALGNGITIYREEQASGLWRVWARLHLDIPLDEYADINPPEVAFLEKRLEEKYAFISAEQMITLLKD